MKCPGCRTENKVSCLEFGVSGDVQVMKYLKAQYQVKLI